MPESYPQHGRHHLGLGAVLALDGDLVLEVAGRPLPLFRRRALIIRVGIKFRYRLDSCPRRSILSEQYSSLPCYQIKLLGVVYHHQVGRRSRREGQVTCVGLSAAAAAHDAAGLQQHGDAAQQPPLPAHEQRRPRDKPRHRRPYQPTAKKKQKQQKQSGNDTEFTVHDYLVLYSPHGARVRHPDVERRNEGGVEVGEVCGRPSQSLILPFLGGAEAEAEAGAGRSGRLEALIQIRTRFNRDHSSCITY